MRQLLNTHISELYTQSCVQALDTQSCVQVSQSGHLLISKQPTYLVTTKLGRTQQYTLLIAVTLAMSSAP